MEENQDIEQIIDIEAYAKEGKTIPKGPKVKYQVRIDGERHIMDEQLVTGRDLLMKAGKNPPEGFRLDQKLRGGATRKIELDDTVDLAAVGVERFMTLPLDNTEG